MGWQDRQPVSTRGDIIQLRRRELAKRDESRGQENGRSLPVEEQSHDYFSIDCCSLHSHQVESVHLRSLLNKKSYRSTTDARNEGYGLRSDDCSGGGVRSEHSKLLRVESRTVPTSQCVASRLWQEGIRRKPEFLLYSC